MWMHFYLEMFKPDFWPRLNNCFLKKCGIISLKNDSIFPKNIIIQSGPKIWLHLYIEMIPHFLRKQCFHIKCVLFRQCSNTELTAFLL